MAIASNPNSVLTLGSYQADSTPVSTTPANRFVLQRGKRNYELSNHLGNVLVTISDRHIPQYVHIPLNGTDFYLADRLSATDYYAFGMPMLGRQFTLAGSSYRFGHNGQERSTEL